MHGPFCAQGENADVNMRAANISPFPFSDVEELREKYTFNITPWSQGLEAAKKGLKILYR